MLKVGAAHRAFRRSEDLWGSMAVHNAYRTTGSLSAVALLELGSASGELSLESVYLPWTRQTSRDAAGATCGLRGAQCLVCLLEAMQYPPNIYKGRRGNGFSLCTYVVRQDNAIRSQ